jgi:bifunctional non-homologous end joining protein LigD
VVLPSLIAPQLATLVETPPAAGNWLYEIKYDGYRMLARIEAGKARLYSRNGHDWTGKLGGVASALSKLETDHTWIDGEVVMLDAHGVSSFQALQNAFERRSDSGVLYFVFDLLYEGGADLRALPLVERKQRLRNLLDGAGSPLVLYSEHLEGSADQALATACRMGLEGLIGKRGDAAYLSGRSRSWIKIKCRKRQEFVVGGYTDPAGSSRQGFGALLLGLHDEDGALRYVGRVGSGFDDRTLQQLHARLQRLVRKQPAFVNPPRHKAREGLHWVRPSLVAEVNFTSWTDEGLLRQASFLGLRNDKPARAITREAVAPTDANGGDRKKAKRAGSSAPGGASKDGVVRVSGVALSNPDRVLYADQGMTKTDLARYYEDVAEWVMPHLAHRPLSIVRCPQDRGKSCFFQKHLDAAPPVGITTLQIEESDGGKDTYFMADKLRGLIALVQLGVLELHTWGSTAPKVERPDRVTFDLDPDPALSWKTLTDGTLLVKALLDELGLRSFLKTTGGKGLHIVMPLARKHTWDEVKGFSHAVAAHLARESPQHFTANMAKQQRKGKIFIDYLRNGRGSTAVAAYSTRARPGAPVSVPLAWPELDEDGRGDHFNINTVRARLLKLRRDPWADYDSVRHTITACMKRSLGIK